MSSTSTALSDTELLARLVAFDTTSCNSNLPLVEFLCDYLDRPGVEIVRNASPEGDKANLVIYAGPPVDPKTREGLVLSGHMDVVPALEPEWTSNPFSLDDRDDRFVARGSADMKGFLALAANRLRSAEKLTRPLVLVFTYDEEVGTVGACHLRHSWPRDRPLPRQAVIGEPTTLNVVRMHKGHLKMRVTLHGVPAHSGYPHLGVNAIEPVGRVILALTGLRRQLETEQPPHHGFFPQVPYVALNVAQIHGGTAVNIVPERCVLDVGARVLPGMDSKEIAERIRAEVERVTASDRCEVELLGDSPPLLLSEDAPLCHHLYDLVHQEETHSASYATDAGWLQQLEMDCAVFGPGSIEVAHKPNEFIPKDQFARGGELLDRLIHELCQDGADSGPSPTP
ncbi:MAG: acetylornithine deacetylase [Acidobacteriota bacterium]|nr:acetylornithine deacetylase [Acidobacteriota bacterium]